MKKRLKRFGVAFMAVVIMAGFGIGVHPQEVRADTGEVVIPLTKRLCINSGWHNVRTIYFSGFKYPLRICFYCGYN